MSKSSLYKCQKQCWVFDKTCTLHVCSMSDETEYTHAYIYKCTYIYTHVHTFIQIYPRQNYSPGFLTYVCEENDKRIDIFFFDLLTRNKCYRNIHE